MRSSSLTHIAVRAAFLMLAASAATLPAHSQDAMQGADFKRFMSGSTAPLTLKMKNLNTDYRRMVVQGQSDSFGTYMQMMGAASGVELGVYYTRGETVTLGGETYLIAYRPQVAIDPAVLRNFGHGDAVVPRKPSPNTSLALSLLNLRTTGSFNDVRPFDPRQDMETAQDANAASVRTLETLGQGFLTYVRLHNNTLPQMPATVTPAFRRSLYPSVHDARTYINPITEQSYRPNPILSGKKLDQILNRQFLPVFYEATPASDGTRGVLFLDGHVERVPANRWDRLKNVKVILRQPVIQTRQAAGASSRVVVVPAPRAR